MEQFQIVPIAKVFESPLNPRKHFNQKKMEELVESVRAKGIMMPLLVRPVDGRFEIAAGHRRYRAAIELKLLEVPLIIREMIDSDFLEVLTIENLQHEDVLPLDEAQGFRTLMEKTNYDVAAISLKVGKSESWIYQRMKLLELIPEAQKLLTEDKITAGHAILIARLQPNEQKECLKEIEEEGCGPGLSVRDLADFIERQIHLDLNSASFSKKDPDLVPEAGPCTTCPKRTGFAPMLFPEIKKKDTCTDPGCFNRKIEAYTAHWLEKQSQDSDIPPLKLSSDGDYRRKKAPENPEEAIPANFYKEITDKKKGSCENAREGIITEGRNKGKVLTVCTDPKCKIHQRYQNSSYRTDPRELARRKAEDERRKFNETIRARVLDQILEKISDLDLEDERFIIAHRFNALWDEYRHRIFKRHGWEMQKGQHGGREYRIEKILALMKIKDLNRLSLEMELINYVRFNEYHSQKKITPLSDMAKRHGIDVKAIEDQVKAEAKAKKEKKSVPVKKKKLFDPEEAVKAAKRLHKDLEDKGKASKGKKKTILDLAGTVPEKDLPCLDCANDATNGEGDCFRENFHADDDGNLICESKKVKVKTSAKKKK